MVVFAERNVELAILEVGMGGRFDAVNAIEPDAGLITNISLDHCDWLGNDIETIAFEKAGIMRANKPVIFAAHDVPRSILRQADEVGSSLIVVGKDFDWSADGEQWSWQGVRHQLAGLERPALAGTHQVGNAAAVLALVEAAGLDELLDVETVNKAFARLQLDGRMQQIDTDVSWVLDVAHNPAASAALADTLREAGHRGQTVAILAMLDDKDVEGFVASLQDQVGHWIAVTADSPRAIEAVELARQVANAANLACLVAGSLDEAINCALQLTQPGDRVLVTGSFYLVGPALNRLYSRR
jgi:dihydrofolate synthase/folylpolyglutamate synthase